MGVGVAGAGVAASVKSDTIFESKKLPLKLLVRDRAYWLFRISDCPGWSLQKAKSIVCVCVVWVAHTEVNSSTSHSFGRLVSD